MPAATAVQTHDWADEILGLNIPVANSAQQTLEQEFNAYLLDYQALSSSLLFLAGMQYYFTLSPLLCVYAGKSLTVSNHVFDGNGCSPDSRIISTM